MLGLAADTQLTRRAVLATADPDDRAELYRVVRIAVRMRPHLGKKGDVVSVTGYLIDEGERRHLAVQVLQQRRSSLRT